METKTEKEEVKDSKKPKEELKGEPLENGWVRWKTTGSNFVLPA